MILALVSGLAHAVGPTKLGTDIVIGSDLSRIVATDDGAWVAAVSGAGSLTLLDPASFQATALSVCSGAAGLAAVPTSGGQHALWVGCPDGTLDRWDVDAYGNVAQVESGLAFTTGAILALQADDTTLYAVVSTDTGAVVDALDLASGLPVGAPWPSALAYDDVIDTMMLGPTLVVVHSQDDVSRVDTATGSAATAQESLGGRSWEDAVAYGTTAAFLADKSGAVVRFDIATNGYTILLDGIAEEVNAVGLEAAATPTWMVAGTPTDTLVYGFSGGPGSLLGTISGVGGTTDFATTDGYAWGLTSSGVVVLTDRPWVEAGEPSATNVSAGDTVTFSFTSDVSGDYSVRLNGGLNRDGEEVDSGTAGAGETISVSVPVTSSFEEGVNHLWVFVGSGATIGHDAVTVTVDNPPPQVPFTAANVGWGDSSIFVELDGLSIADLAGYAVFVSSTPYTADEWPTGGPDFGDSPSSNPGKVDAPRLVAAGPDEPVSLTFSPLENGTTYYVAVRAYDTNQNEGPMSSVQPIAPQETFSASELRGDPGGFCGTRSGPALGFLVSGLAGLAALRRRAVVPALVGAALIAPAHAKDPDPPHWNAQLAGGLTQLADPVIVQVFGENSVYIRGEYGYTSRFVEVVGGTGYLQKKGYLVTESGEVSNEDDKITVVPFMLEGRLRLDFFHEQILVPFGGAGGDYLMWKEKWWVADNPDGDSRASGVLGWHWDAGAWLRLDPLDPRSASAIEAEAGIDDSYLTFEYRKTYMTHSSKKLDLSDHEFLIGVKCDF